MPNQNVWISKELAERLEAAKVAHRKNTGKEFNTSKVFQEALADKCDEVERDTAQLKSLE